MLHCGSFLYSFRIHNIDAGAYAACCGNRVDAEINSNDCENRQLKEQKDEKQRLKKLRTDQALDMRMRKEITIMNWYSTEAKPDDNQLIKARLSELATADRDGVNIRSQSA